MFLLLALRQKVCQYKYNKIGVGQNRCMHSAGIIIIHPFSVFCQIDHQSFTECTSIISVVALLCCLVCLPSSLVVVTWYPTANLANQLSHLKYCRQFFTQDWAPLSPHFESTPWNNNNKSTTCSIRIQPPIGSESIVLKDW